MQAELNDIYLKQIELETAMNKLLQLLESNLGVQENVKEEPSPVPVQKVVQPQKQVPPLAKKNPFFQAKKTQQSVEQNEFETTD